MNQEKSRKISNLQVNGVWLEENLQVNGVWLEENERLAQVLVEISNISV
jgi:hypothetical protein